MYFTESKSETIPDIKETPMPEGIQGCHNFQKIFLDLETTSKNGKQQNKNNRVYFLYLSKEVRCYFSSD